LVGDKAEFQNYITLILIEDLPYMRPHMKTFGLLEMCTVSTKVCQKLCSQLAE